jgi:hypothetical protein
MRVRDNRGDEEQRTPGTALHYCPPPQPSSSPSARVSGFNEDGVIIMTSWRTLLPEHFRRMFLVRIAPSRLTPLAILLYSLLADFSPNCQSRFPDSFAIHSFVPRTFYRPSSSYHGFNFRNIRPVIHSQDEPSNLKLRRALRDSPQK